MASEERHLVDNIIILALQVLSLPTSAFAMACIRSSVCSRLTLAFLPLPYSFISDLMRANIYIVIKSCLAPWVRVISAAKHGPYMVHMPKQYASGSIVTNTPILFKYGSLELLYSHDSSWRVSSASAAFKIGTNHVSWRWRVSSLLDSSFLPHTNPNATSYWFVTEENDGTSSLSLAS